MKSCRKLSKKVVFFNQRNNSASLKSCLTDARTKYSEKAQEIQQTGAMEQVAEFLCKYKSHVINWQAGEHQLVSMQWAFPTPSDPGQHLNFV